MTISDNLNDQKYVAFLDVLGFKELVKKKGEKLDEYFDTITKAIDDINLDKSTIKSQLVSDSTILACDLTNDNLRLLLKAVQTIQARCAVKNLWIRGAVSIGDIYFDSKSNIVVGNGLSDAYLLESQEKYPRVIIDPRIIKNSFGTRQDFINICNNNMQHLAQIPLIHDIRIESRFIDTSVLFVSFANIIIADNIDNLEVIFDNIKSELYSSQLAYGKYFWLKGYFSEVTEKFDTNIFNPIDHFENQKLSDKIFNHFLNFDAL